MAFSSPGNDHVAAAAVAAVYVGSSGVPGL